MADLSTLKAPLKPMGATDVIDLAYSYIGTPYKHQGRLKGVGLDCLGLLICLYKDIYGDLPLPEKDIPKYNAQWAEFSRSERNAPFEKREPMLHAANTWLISAPSEARFPRPGDVVMFRIKERGPVKHCAVMDTKQRIIHAYDGHHVLSAAPSSEWFRPNRMHVYCWPGVRRWPL